MKEGDEEVWRWGDGVNLFWYDNQIPILKRFSC